MPATDNSDAADAPRQGVIRTLLARDGWAVLAAGAVTVAAELGVLLIGRAGGASPRAAVLAALATMTLWVALSAPALAAGGRSGLSALLRGGIVVDASAVTLLILWLTTPYVTLVAALQIYCILAAVALACIAAVRCFRRPLGQAAAAVAAATVLAGALATGFWTGGLLRAAGGAALRPAVTAAVVVNPFYSILSAVAEEVRFVWHQAPVMYRLTRIGDYAAPPPVHWTTAVVVYGALAGMLAAAHLLRRARPGA